VKRSLIPSLHNRVSTTYQERQDLFNEIGILRHYLQIKGYSQGFIDSVINSKNIRRPNKEEKLLGSVCVPYMKNISEKLKLIGNRYNIRMIFKTKSTLTSSLMKTRPGRDPQQAAQCVYIIPCECGKDYIGETGRLLAVRRSLKEGLLEKSKLGQHAYEKRHRVVWDEVGFWKMKVTAGV
jgi:hypothetical protein